MAEQNLVLYSQEFDNAAWNKNNCNITPNTTTAPDGTSTAESLTENTVNTLHYLSTPLGASVIGQVYTLSIYAKANTRTIILLYTAMNGNGGTYFDLSAGTIGTTNGVAPTSSAISSVGNGWYRCSITYTATITSGVNAFQCFLVQSGTIVTYTGDGTSGVYVWGAQLENRSAISAYTATTTQAITNYIPVLQTAASGVARFDNNPTTGESLGLLIEESRTNLLTYSSQFNDAYWTKLNCSITANSNVAPDGTLSADLVTATSGTEEVYTFGSKSASAITYTWSVYAKAYFGVTTGFSIYLSDNSTGQATGTYNFTNATASASNGSWSNSSATITSVGNGWFRCTLTATSPANTGLLFGITWGSSSGQAVYLWGAQLEQGAFPTSYIATTSASATRTADVAVMTGTNFSSWFNYGQMTIYWEATGYYTDGGFEVFDLDSGSNTGRIRTRFSSASQVDQLDASGGLPVSLDGGTVTANAFSKIATGLTQNSQALSFNNGAVVTSSAPFTSLPIPTAARIGTNWVPSEFLNGTIKKIAYYPIKVTNAQLQALTS